MRSAANEKYKSLHGRSDLIPSYKLPITERPITTFGPCTEFNRTLKAIMEPLLLLLASDVACSTILTQSTRVLFGRASIDPDISAFDAHVSHS